MITQKGEKANITKSCKLVILLVSLFRFKGNIEEKYIGIINTRRNIIFGRDLLILAKGAKILWIGKYALLVPTYGSNP